MVPPCRPFSLPLRPHTSSLPQSAAFFSRASTCPFSTTSPQLQRRRGRNPNRGVSPLRKTGLQSKLSVHKYPLPKPVLTNYLAQPETPADHGLWGFFDKKKTRVSNPESEREYGELYLGAYMTWDHAKANQGRPWTLAELRTKSWEDLHALWWVCCKDLNRISTSKQEGERLEIGFGTKDYETRMKHVRTTQKFIKWALTERWYGYEEARKLAANDPSVDLAADEGAAYKPHLEEDSMLEAEARNNSEGNARI